MSEIGILPTESEVTAVVASEELVSPPDPIKEAAEVIVRDVRSISDWREYTDALGARQKARGKVGTNDKIVFTKDGKVYVVAMKGGEASNVQDISVRVIRANAIPANLSLDDLNGTAELPDIKWDNLLEARSVKEMKPSERPSIRYQSAG